MKTFLSLFGWLFLVNLVTAQKPGAVPEWKTATSNGYAYRYVANDPMKARFYTLKNGLTVILSVNKKEPRIFSFMPTRAGSNTDPRSNTGLAHYLEHMLFKGTDKYGSLDWAKEKPLLDQIDALYERYNKTTDTVQRKAIYREIDQKSGEAAQFAIANEYDKMIASMGGQNSNAFTSYEVTCYLEDIPANALDRYLTLQAERFRQPVLRIFHTELEAVYEEKNRSLDNDPWKVEEVLMAALFPVHNYGQQTTIGTVEHLKNPSLVEIRNYFSRYYVPNNMAIILAGDLNPDEVIKKIDQKFSFWQPKEVQLYKPAPEAPLTQIQTREVFGPTPDNVRIGYRIPGALDVKSSLLATLADEIMSNSAAGLIDLNLNKQQKILGGGSTLEKLKDYSVWSLSGRPKKGQSLEEVKDLLIGQVEKLKRGEFDEKILRAIINNYKLNAIRALENNYSRVTPLLDAFVNDKGESWVSYTRRLNDMSKITKKEVVDFANQWFKDNYVIVYKRKGEDKSIQKVDKPTITPVATNTDKQSPFLQTVNDIPMAPVKPVWLDYKKDVKRGKAGITDVLYAANVENQIFRLGYRLKMGTYHSKLLGLATQYLSFLSTDKLSAEQVSTEFYNLACSYSIQANTDYTTIRLSGLQENFAPAVKLLETLIRSCKPDEKALEELKGRILKQRADTKLSKQSIMQGLMQYAEYGPKNPFNNQLTNDELQQVTAADLVAFIHGLIELPHSIIYYGPEPLAVFEKQIVTLHKLPTAFAAVPKIQVFKQVSQPENQVLFADYDMVQSEISWVRNTTVFDPAQTPIVEFYNNYFGGGMASVVFQTLRESKALAYSTYAYYNTPTKKDHQYTLIGYIGSQADKLPEAVAGMNELLNALPESPVALEAAKKGMKKGYETERILQDAVIYNYLSAEEKGLDYDERQKIYDSLDQLSYTDLKKFSDEYLANKPYTYCIVASEKRVNPADLNKYGKVTKLSLEEIFGY
ncbi:M16 family metallopeptidase [Larkinella rosea]|uniref:Insulinase family protein n=1 Tax=Larkinella rosea TaxID=2025312 RepID=A0A3P1BIQ7_9BACT|nr:M16 family metallopeptidase [Larkinella rosea]RRB00961.1 insulinase family protein [Larkinella rosea]